MAAMGPGIDSQGLITTGANCLSNNCIAATLLELLEQDYQSLNPNMGAPMRAFLQ